MMTGMMRQIVRTGDLGPVMAMFQGGGRGAPGFGPPPAWNARPGEQAVGGAAGGGRGGGGVTPAGAPSGAAPAGGAPAGAAPAAAAMPDPSAFQPIVALFSIPGRPASGGFGLDFLQTLGFGNAAFAAFGGGGGAGVSSGDYVAVLSVGGKTFRQKIRVERAMQ
jgi:hypothetical protein